MADTELEELRRKVQANPNATRLLAAGCARTFLPETPDSYRWRLATALTDRGKLREVLDETARIEGLARSVGVAVEDAISLKIAGDAAWWADMLKERTRGGAEYEANAEERARLAQPGSELDALDLIAKEAA